MGEMSNDPVVDEVRAARRQISERVDHDSARLVAYYMELQKRYQDRLIHLGSGEDRANEVSLTHDCSASSVRTSEPSH